MVQRLFGPGFKIGIFLGGWIRIRFFLHFNVSYFVDPFLRGGTTFLKRISDNLQIQFGQVAGSCLFFLPLSDFRPDPDQHQDLKSDLENDQDPDHLLSIAKSGMDSNKDPCLSFPRQKV